MVRVRERDLTFLLGSGLELRLGALRAVPLKLAIAAADRPGLLAQGGYLYLDVSVPGPAGSGYNPQVSVTALDFGASIGVDTACPEAYPAVR